MDFKVKYPNTEGSHKEIRVLDSPTKKTEVSVLIPTADAHRNGYFEKLMEQIRNQTFKDFEIIIVVGDQRQGRAINQAAALAKGNLLIILDDDARLGQDTVFEKLVLHTKNDPKIGMAGVSNIIPDDANFIVRTIMKQVPRRSSPIVQKIIESDMAEHPCCAIPKHIFYQIGGENEIIPRGLDPYLRSQIRKAGYKIVVIPNTFIHHLPPETLRGNLKQFFRNGKQSAYANKNFPEFVIDLTTTHTDNFEEKISFSNKILRLFKKLFISIIKFEWMHLFFMIFYYYGFVVGFFFEKPAKKK
ncbi:glycosyltransferase [bacterium]|nr:glycosyltransferase [bacterium]